MTFLGSTLSVVAWLASVHPDSLQSRHRAVIGLARLQAKQKDEETNSKSESSTFFGFFSDGNRDIKREKDAPEEKSVLRSIQRLFEGRKGAQKVKSEEERDKKLAVMFDKENTENSFLSDGLDFSTITSALENVEAGLKQARDELVSVRSLKDDSKQEEKRLDELRKQAAIDRQAKVRAQRVAEQRKIDRREQQKKLSEKAKQRSELRKRVRKASAAKGSFSEEDEDTESSKRANPLSAAQKLVAGVFDKQKVKEQWIVVAPKTRISPGEIVPISSAGLDLLLVASKDGSSLHCIANSCPHLGTPLETGILDRRPVEAADSSASSAVNGSTGFQENDIANLLAQDGCENCIVCPLHKTAFALESGEVRGEWCPYPPVLGKVMGTVKDRDTLPVFDVRTRGKNIEVRLNTPFKAKKS